MGVKPLKLLKFNTIIFTLALGLGLMLRVYKLDSTPPGLTWDEAALGYNAYSISQTLRDEYGNFLPLILKSFGDYKPALYAYLDIPFVLILDLNEWAVRLPSVFAGIGFIMLCYLIVKEIFKDNRLSLAAAFFAAISPLSLQFSRAGFESNIAVFFNMLGLYLFLKGIKNSGYFYESAAAFILSLLCYQGSKIFVPIILIGLFVFFRKYVKLNRNLLLSISLLTVSIMFVYFITFFGGQSDRLAAQNLFAYTRSQEQVELIANEASIEPESLEFQLLHGEWWEFVRGILERYLIYFSPGTVFIEGDYSPRHSVPDLGILNYYGIILIPFGFYLLWRKREPAGRIILFWLFTASIPAVFSRDLISMVRALNLMFPLVVLEAFGFIFLMNKLLQNKREKFLFSGLIFLIVVNFLVYLDFYFVHLSKQNSEGWVYGYKEVITQMPQISKYNKVVFTDEYGQPYIYYLFYSKYDPLKYHPQANLEQKTVDVGTVRKIDNIEFRKINWPVDRGLENTLLIGTGIEIPDHDISTEKKSNKLLQVNFLDGKEAFKIIENGYE